MWKLEMGYDFLESIESTTGNIYVKKLLICKWATIF
jgi:hypothetical protein